MKSKKILFSNEILFVFATIIILFTQCEKENVPPVCDIISPENSAVFALGDVITINVEAKDSDGKISDVRLLINDVNVSSTQIIPYSFNWDTDDEDPGVYKIKVIARDEMGLEDLDTISVIISALPLVVTGDISNVSNTGATIEGNISYDGGSEVIARGVCCSTSINPTTSDTHTSDGSGTGSFTSSLTGLSPGVTYYVRTYATNILGTSYGNEITFTTLDIPTSITTRVSAITLNSAQTGGNITDDGGSNVTARGVCWSTSPNPTIADNRTTDGKGTGVFTSSLTGLSSGTTFYVRAYATNSIGTAYGDEVTFRTRQSNGIGNYTFTIYTAPDGIINSSVFALTVDNSNNIWIGTRYNGISKFDGTLWANYTSADGLISDTTSSLAIDNSGFLWIGTKEGISKFNGTTWTNYTETDGLINNDVRSLAVDQQNSIWIGTNYNGISKFDGSDFTKDTVNIPVSHGRGHIHTICCDLDENMWVGSCISGLSKFDGQFWTHTINGFSTFVMASACDNNGNVWIGRYFGLYKYDGISWTDYSSADGTIDNLFVNVITEDLDGNIWAGTTSGLWIFDGNNWLNFTTDDGLYYNNINAIACDQNGDIWVEDLNGLMKISKD